MRVRLLKPNRSIPWLFAMLHLALCAATFLYLYPASKWGLAPILLLDYPASGIFADSANSDAVMTLEFVVLGTLWWFLLSYAFARILEWFVYVIGWMFGPGSPSGED